MGIVLVVLILLVVHLQEAQSLDRDQEDGGPTVSWVENGGRVQVIGSWMKTNKNTSFASFQGNPYAYPPIHQNQLNLIPHLLILMLEVFSKQCVLNRETIKTCQKIACILMSTHLENMMS